MDSASSIEQVARQRIFSLLELRLQNSNGTIDRAALEKFEFDGTTQRLIDTRKGVWNPRNFDSTLSIVSADDGPYPDEEVFPGVWKYHYESGNERGSSLKLRKAYEQKVPIILLRRVANGVYIPHFPAFVIADDPSNRWCLVAVEESADLYRLEESDSRKYAERFVRQRIHQKEFRSKVLRAYDDTCAICKLNRPELLDAAHIIPDVDPKGKAVISNGLSLCKIHHTAYDKNLIGIDADYRVHVGSQLLDITDGPMLKFGIQAMHGNQLHLPTLPVFYPDQNALADRFLEFQNYV